MGVHADVIKRNVSWPVDVLDDEVDVNAGQRRQPG
jgi:hypothetical protein